jgi:hypothetical protein
MDAIVSRLMAKEPADRYPVAAMVAADLRSAATALEAPGVSASVAAGSSAPVRERPLRGPIAAPPRRRATWLRAVLIAVAVIGALWLAASAFSGRWLTTLGRAGRPEEGLSATTFFWLEGWRA